MVRVGTPSAVARPDWYDRNPVSRVDYYWGSGVAPHGVTTRLSYTVPSGKKAMVEVLVLKVRRNTAATTLGIARASLILTPSGGAPDNFMDACIVNNTVDVKDGWSIGASLALITGDLLEFTTYDGSTGGTCDYWLSYKITEFDA